MKIYLTHTFIYKFTTGLTLNTQCGLEALSVFNGNESRPAHWYLDIKHTCEPQISWKEA